MAGTYTTMAHVSDVLERIAIRHAALDTLHAEAAARAADTPPPTPAPVPAHEGGPHAQAAARS